ncbi:MAG: SUMF1/EgtB/PvdO family nonheme iron enzyme [Planctomycetales bacterium]|nr:SUMF1/EgtB/PvdO family nonheme iron enzyme [Planctomycetales bacterium]
MRALRQCDGYAVQALLVVRDDFWLALNRFMNSLELPLQEGVNCLMVDRFDERHAKTVLQTLGTAYGRLPRHCEETTAEQRDFVEKAASLLALNGRVSPVSLALFVEFMKSRDWSPETLRAFDGPAGIPGALLDSMFMSAQSPFRQRQHAAAATRVLECLLPPSGVEINNQTRSLAELQTAAGYGADTDSFKDLIRLLDLELRLIAPAAPIILKGSNEQSRLRKSQDTPSSTSPVLEDKNTTPSETLGAGDYQLTHDYLVSALRAWLRRYQATTPQGRASLLLKDRTDEWQASRDARLLPNWYEYLTIAMRTSRHLRTGAEQAMLSRARHRLARRASIGFSIVAIVMIVLTWVWIRHQSARREAMMDNLLVARSEDVMPIAEGIRPWRNALRSRIDARQLPIEKRIRFHIGMLPDENAVEELTRIIVEGDDDPRQIDDFALVCRALRPVREMAITKLRNYAGGELAPAARFRVNAALLMLDDLSAEYAEHVTRHLLTFSDERRGLWNAIWQEKMVLLHETLLRVFEEPPISVTNDGDKAVSDAAFQMLREHFAEDVPTRVLLIQEARAQQLHSVLPTNRNSRDWLLELRDHLIRAASVPTSEYFSSAPSHAEPPASYGISAKPSSDTESVGVRIGFPENEGETFDPTWTSRLKRANCGLAVLYLSALLENESTAETGVAPLSWDEQLRGEMLYQLARANLPRGWLERRFVQAAESAKTSPQELRWLMLAIGLCESGENSNRSEQVGYEDGKARSIARTDVAAVIREQLEANPDSGVHSAAWWLLKRWELESEAELPRVANLGHDSDWEDTGSGLTMLRFHTDPHRLQSLRDVLQESHLFRLHEKRLFPLSTHFSLSATEITRGQFRDVVGPGLTAGEPELNGNLPRNQVRWHEAGEFCNQLSKKANMPPEQWAYDPIRREFDTSKVGFRLPTWMEWQYAVHGDSTQSRFFGESDAMLDEYAWYNYNSRKSGFLPVATKLPSPVGLFDVYGNVAEWTADTLSDDSEGITVALIVGGAYDDVPAVVRNRVWLSETIIVAGVQQHVLRETLGSMGFRVARTLPE